MREKVHAAVDKIADGSIKAGQKTTVVTKAARKKLAVGLHRMANALDKSNSHSVKDNGKLPLTKRIKSAFSIILKG